jgi:hypothetical protein
MWLLLGDLERRQGAQRAVHVDAGINASHVLPAAPSQVIGYPVEVVSQAGSQHDGSTHFRFHGLYVLVTGINQQVQLVPDVA